MRTSWTTVKFQPPDASCQSLFSGRSSSPDACWVLQTPLPVSQGLLEHSDLGQLHFYSQFGIDHLMTVQSHSIPVVSNRAWHRAEAEVVVVAMSLQSLCLEVTVSLIWIWHKSRNGQQVEAILKLQCSVGSKYMKSGGLGKKHVIYPSFIFQKNFFSILDVQLEELKT